MTRATSVVAAVVAAVVLASCAGGGGGGGGGTTTTSSTTAPPTTVPVATRLCAGTAPQQVGTATDGRLTEVSGVVQSRAHPNVLWVHNDSGDSARVFAIKRDGTMLREYPLADASATDWEDIAISPGSNGGRDALYLGDIGDNNEARADITIYAIDEPDPATDTTTGTVRSQRLLYPDGAHNAEAMFVDPATHDLFIVTKVLTGASVVYRKAGGLLASEPTLTKVATLDLGVGQLVTAGDISPDGSAIVLRTYGAVFVWSRRPGEDIAAAFGRQPCRAPAPGERQGEAIGTDPDGRGFVTMSEGTGQPIWHVTAG
jgi:hypothetical protein